MSKPPPVPSPRQSCRPALGPLHVSAFAIVVQLLSQLLSRIRLLATPWTTAHHGPLSFTISRSLLKLMSIESMMPSNHLIFCHLPSPPALNLSHQISYQGSPKERVEILIDIYVFFSLEKSIAKSLPFCKLKTMKSRFQGKRVLERCALISYLVKIM